MPEARVDPMSGLRTMVATERAARPHAWPQVAPPQEFGEDPFAQGNEHMTPPEVWADRPDGSAPDSPGWLARAVPNKYPALDQGYPEEMPASGLKDPLGTTRGMPQLLTTAPAAGMHEVIVNSPRAVRSLAELSLDELSVATAAWAARIAAHTAEGQAQYIHVCVNERLEAGATLAHTHAQLFALPFVPPPVARERERMRAYYEHTQGRNLLEDLLVEEIRGGERLIAIDDHAALIAPFASPSPYRLAVVPRKPEARYDESAERGTAMLQTALRALAGAIDFGDGAAPPLNLWVRTAPHGAEGYSWRIEIAPRLGQPAGFELGTGAGLNAVAPEQAAAELREALK